MPQCKGCEKRGLFLKLNARGLCAECAAKAEMVPKSGQLNITIGGVNTANEYADLGHEREEAICQYFIDNLVDRGKDRALFKIEHRASDYTSLVYDEHNDLLRCKSTNNVSWVSLALTNEDQQKYMDDPLFSAQDNKGQRHWRSDFEAIDQLDRYLDMAENACEPIPIGCIRDITANEKIIADYIYDLFIDCGAEPENMFYYTLAHDFELLYKNDAGGIRFKSFAKKSGGYIIITDRIFERTKLNKKSKDRKFAFTELSDLDCLKEEYIPLKIEEGTHMASFYNERYLKYDREAE